MERGKVIWKLFISTLYLSAFTFGGGYVIITLMKKKFVDEYHWIDEEEMQFFSGFRNTFALIYGDENTDVAKCHNPVLSRLKYENT